MRLQRGAVEQYYLVLSDFFAERVERERERKIQTIGCATLVAISGRYNVKTHRSLVQNHGHRSKNRVSSNGGEEFLF